MRAIWSNTSLHSENRTYCLKYHVMSHRVHRLLRMSAGFLSLNVLSIAVAGIIRRCTLRRSLSIALEYSPISYKDNRLIRVRNSSRSNVNLANYFETACGGMHRDHVIFSWFTSVAYVESQKIIAAVTDQMQDCVQSAIAYE